MNKDKRIEEIEPELKFWIILVGFFLGCLIVAIVGFGIQVTNLQVENQELKEQLEDYQTEKNSNYSLFSIPVEDMNKTFSVYTYDYLFSPPCKENNGIFTCTFIVPYSEVQE